MTLKEISKATKEDLQSFAGIGPSISERLVENQPYKAWKDVEAVPYVEDWMVEKLKEKDKRPSNPNGANLRNPDPRQAKFLANFLDPESDTYSNAKASAMEAGYSETYALRITSNMPEWLSETVKHGQLVEKAMRNLNEFLDEEEDKRLKWQVSEFTLERLNKELFGKNVDITSGGEQIKPELTEEQKEKLIEEVIQKYKT